MGHVTKFGTIRPLFSAGSTADSSNYFSFELDANDKLAIYERQSVTFVTAKVTSQVFRDPTAWYIFQLDVDMANATAEDRFILRVNGVRVTSWSSNTVQSQNTDTWVNSTNVHRIGLLANYDSYGPFDGDLIVALFDGVNLGADVAASQDDNGYWMINDFTSQSFGTNGFFIKSGDGVDVKPGGGCNYTPVNSPVTVDDSPTNDPANDVGLYAVLRPYEGYESTVVLSNAGTTSAASSGLPYVTSTLRPDHGKWYYEVYIDANYAGYPSVGTNAGTLNSFSATDRIGYAVDIDAGKEWWRINGGSWVGGGDPEAGTTPSGTFTAGSNLSVLLRHSNTSKATVRFLPSTWTGTPPTGFKPICTAHLYEPDCADPDTEYYCAVFSHSGFSTTITLPWDHSVHPTMVRVKRTSASGNWVVFDTVRGSGYYFNWNTSDVEVYVANNLTFSTGDTTQIVIGSGFSSATYLIEAFKAGSYFQILTWTGNSTAGRTLSFTSALAAKPGFMALKPRTQANQAVAYHSAEGATKYVRLDLASTFNVQNDFLNSTEPTATGVTLGVMDNVNANPYTYVGYFWANTGPYRFGSHVGNGNADGPAVWLGGSPKTETNKCSSTTGSWMQTTRVLDPGNPTEDQLYWESTSSIATATVSDFLATGFKARTTGGNINASGQTYVEMAFGVRALRGPGTAQARAV